MPNKVDSSFATARKGIEKLNVANNQEANQNTLDIYRIFAKVFNNKNGEKVLEYLERYSHTNFPNYDNVNATYSKIGEQVLVSHIKTLLLNAKKIK